MLRVVDNAQQLPGPSLGRFTTAPTPEDDFELFVAELDSRGRVVTVQRAQRLSLVRKEELTEPYGAPGAASTLDATDTTGSRRDLSFRDAQLAFGTA